jgi:hypothetical protein
MEARSRLSERLFSERLFAFAGIPAPDAALQETKSNRRGDGRRGVLEEMKGRILLPRRGPDPCFRSWRLF